VNLPTSPTALYRCWANAFGLTGMAWELAADALPEDSRSCKTSAPHAAPAVTPLVSSSWSRASMAYEVNVSGVRLWDLGATLGPVRARFYGPGSADADVTAYQGHLDVKKVTETGFPASD
jgi:hypothetical protein